MLVGLNRTNVQPSELHQCPMCYINTQGVAVSCLGSSPAQQAYNKYKLLLTQACFLPTTLSQLNPYTLHTPLHRQLMLSPLLRSRCTRNKCVTKISNGGLPHREVALAGTGADPRVVGRMGSFSKRSFSTYHEPHTVLGPCT